MGKTVLSWVTVIDPALGIKRKKMPVPEEFASSDPYKETLKVSDMLLLAIKATIIMGATCPELVETLRLMFHDDPELTDDRLGAVLQQGYYYELDETELEQVSAHFNQPVAETKRRMAVLAHKNTEWRHGQRLFTVVHSMDTVKEAVTSAVNSTERQRATTSKPHDRSKRKRAAKRKR